jgi:very-long-chain (3R)-3-hydroxyacyl-CoA dehydratase
MSAGKKLYLFLYNAIQWYGWVAILTDRIYSYDTNGITVVGQVFLYFFQTLAVLEIVNAATGIVRANVVTTTVQVLSRVQILLITLIIPDVNESSGMIAMITAWGLVEVVRYLYLALNMFGIAPKFLTWLRYSLFYVLYPLGVYGEMKVLFDALPELTSSDYFSVRMPNSWNFEFSFSGYIWVLLHVIYLPGLYVQYTHMIQQRKKALGADSIPKKTE